MDPNESTAVPGTGVPPVSANPTPVEITSLAQLDELVRQPVTVEFFLGGRTVRVPAYRLRPEQEAKVAEILGRALPKIIKGEKPGEEDRYDFADPEYQSRKRRNEQTAQALTLYLACPWLAKSAPDGTATDEEKLRAWLSGHLTTEIIEAIYNAVTGQTALAPSAEYAGFFSTAASAAPRR